MAAQKIAMEASADGGRTQEGRTLASLLEPALAGREPLDAAATPRLAEALARAAAAAWERWREAGQIDASHPLLVLDLAPGSGRLAVRFVQALRALAPAQRWCYVACARGREACALLQVPELAELADAGLFDTADWRDAWSGRLMLRGRREAAPGRANPVVALALGAWRRRPCEYWGVHHDRRFVATVARAPADADEAIAVEWQATDRPASRLAEPILAHYQRRITSACVPVPVQALRTIDALRRFCGGRSLLVSVDDGLTSELHLRLGEGWPPRSVNEGVRRSNLNFHALRLHCEAHGASVRDSRLHERGWVVQACLEGGGAGGDVLAERIAHALADGHPQDDCLHETLAGQAQSPEQALAVVRAARHDPRVLVACAAMLQASAGEMAPGLRDAWREALAQAARRLLSQDAASGQHAALCDVACAFGCWALARAILRGAMRADIVGVALRLARVAASTGHVGEALALLGMRELAGCGAARTLRRSLVLRLRRWRRLPWCGKRLPQDAELTLEPLGPEHRDVLLARYLDAQIAQLTGLPRLRTPRQVEEWMAPALAAAGAFEFAIMHRDEGFVGVVGGRRVAATATFHFWLGAEVQGQGLGPRAARLLFEHLRGRGVAAVVTTVLGSNHRSLASMRKLGMRELSMRPLPPNELLVPFAARLDGRAEDERELAQALRVSYGALSSPVVFPPAPEDGAATPAQGCDAQLATSP